MTTDLGSDDPFRDVSNWDEATAREWVEILDQRAAAPDHVRIRGELIKVANLRQGDTVVELGCGAGALLIDLAGAVGPTGRVVGIDPQPHLVDAARGRARREKPASRIEVEVGSTETIPLPASSAHACVAQTVFIHLGDEAIPRSLAEIRRVLRPGGLFVSVDQDGDTWIIDHPNRELTRRIVTFHSDHRYADGWTGRRLHRHLLEAGFKDIDVRAAVHVDASIGSYLHGMALRIAQAAASAGAISADEADEWSHQLRELATRTGFFSSINYFITSGVSP